VSCVNGVYTIEHSERGAVAHGVSIAMKGRREKGICGKCGLADLRGGPGGGGGDAPPFATPTNLEDLIPACE
jgi:hypothetical protein